MIQFRCLATAGCVKNTFQPKMLQLNVSNENEEFPISMQFKSNEATQTILKENLHLNEDQKQVKKSLDKLIVELNTLREEFIANQFNYELNIHKHFVEIRRKIDAQRQSITLSSNYSYSYSTTRVGVGTRVVLE